MEGLEEEIGSVPPIKDYYQPNPCLKRGASDWETGPIRSIAKMNIEQTIKEFLKSKDKVLLLAADFGTGKTTASKILTSKYAKDFERVDSKNYIPMFFRLIENSREDVESKVEEVMINEYQRALLILDGLDEITSEERDEIVSLVAEYRKNYPNMKIIITTRFGIYPGKSKGKFFRKLGLRHFYQLQPLTKELAENMLERLGGLSIDEVKSLKISEEEYTKPIYLYLLWVLKKTGRLEKLKGYGRSGIYLALTNLVSRYKAKCVEDKEIKKELKEKNELKARKILIHIAVLRTMFESEELSKEEIRELLSDDVRKDLDEIGADFLITTYLRNPDNLTFIHKSFQEYLSAEYLFINFLSGKFEGLYMFSLTQEIFEFLKGLVAMFSNCWKKNELEEFKELLEIDNININKKSINEQIEHAKEVLERRVYYIVPPPKSENKVKLEANPDEMGSTKDIIIKYSAKEKDKHTEYNIIEAYQENISGFNTKFCTIKISKYFDDKEVVKNFVSGTIVLIEICQTITDDKFLTSVSEVLKDTLSYILKLNKLHSINLSRADLSRTVLSGIDLRGGDLRGADLSRADLSRADLNGAMLSGADLRGADLSRADLRGAVLSRSDLNGADLRGADLKGADLSGAVLSRTDLSRSDLRGADLSRADLRGAVLSRSDLNGADLRGADLSRADLRGAVLSRSDLNNITWKPHPPTVAGADFENAEINDKEFVEYLRKNGAINVPDPVED